MITFINNCSNEPYLRLQEEYDKALKTGQKVIEAICISSLDASKLEVDSRFVNLKIVDNEKFIFFSNYYSPKARQFESCNTISSVIYWTETNVQIRMKANLKKLSEQSSNEYFKKRAKHKNALAISSMQSERIESYDRVVEKYQQVLKNENLEKRPKYWGGYEFTPFYFEFWEGNKSRLNKRDSYTKDGELWEKFTLQP